MGWTGRLRYVYQVGVVLALPCSPDRARRTGWVTLGDDVYLVGMLDKNGSPESDDHEHMPEALLFPTGHEVPEELRSALGRRFAGSGWAGVL